MVMGFHAMALLRKGIIFQTIDQSPLQTAPPPGTIFRDLSHYWTRLPAPSPRVLQGLNAGFRV